MTGSTKRKRPSPTEPFPLVSGSPATFGRAFGGRQWAVQGGCEVGGGNSELSTGTVREKPLPTSSDFVSHSSSSSPVLSLFSTKIILVAFHTRDLLSL